MRFSGPHSFCILHLILSGFFFTTALSDAYTFSVFGNLCRIFIKEVPKISGEAFRVCTYLCSLDPSALMYGDVFFIPFEIFLVCVISPAGYSGDLAIVIGVFYAE